MVPDFGKANWEGFVGKKNWEYLLKGKNTYQMWVIFNSILNKVKKQFLPLKKIRNNKEV